MIPPFPIVQNKNFVEFLVFEGLFLPQEVDQIRNLWNADQSEKAQLSGEEEYKDDLRQSNIMAIEWDDQNQWVYQRIQQATMQSNASYYYYDLVGFNEPLQLTEYGQDGFFDWHLDFGPGANSTRKLSLTVQLSDPEEYEGGDLQFRINQNEVSAPKKKGTAIVFPSFIMHRVAPVTKGTRRSIVGWIHGIPFR